MKPVSAGSTTLLERVLWYLPILTVLAVLVGASQLS